MGELVPAWEYGASGDPKLVPADGYGFGIESAVDSKLMLATPYLDGEADETSAPESDTCIETTKKGYPCRGRKIQDTDYCFSHLRKHREPTADQGLRS